MADALTTILRPMGEAPHASLRASCIVQAFARVILCLRGARRAATGGGKGGKDLQTNSAARNEVRAELAARLDLIADPAVSVGPAEVPLIAAARLMLDDLNGRSRGFGLSAIARTEVPSGPRGESDSSRQVGYLVAEALSAFAAITRDWDDVASCGGDNTPTPLTLRSGTGETNWVRAVARLLRWTAIRQCRPGHQGVTRQVSLGLWIS